MFSTIDMREALGNPQPKENPRSIFIDHFSKVSRSKLARAKAASRSHTKPNGPRKRRSPPPPPELVHDNTISEESTPVTTPVHAEFNLKGVQRRNGEYCDVGHVGRNLDDFG
ncbi:hypothetical protein FRC08_008877 [Ceratobasidium sp. 394]|nr:hypothetical protein FRC08_008877 [Ceratobasidium sp. 394]KAG9083254.1 hypothetical protein FS749_006182 [Ceratobasidium sp. UAMH 11750]